MESKNVTNEQTDKTRKRFKHREQTAGGKERGRWGIGEGD